MNNKRAAEIFLLLSHMHPDAGPELNYKNNFELLVAVILSAQCTDKRVNIVTDKLFKIAPNPEVLSKMELNKIENIIKTCGLYRNKAKFLKKTSTIIFEKYNSNIPNSREDLMKLAGVSQKTANVVMSVGFGVPAIAVDTHVFRVSRRIGFSLGKKPLDVEKDLEKRFAKKHWIKLHHLLIFHGRRVCKAANPNCEDCIINELCEKIIENKS